MKRIAVGAMFVFVGVFLSGCKTVPDKNNVEQAVNGAQHHWEEALIQFEPESMESLLAEDDLQTDFRGVVQHKTSWRHDFKSVTANVHSGQTQWDCPAICTPSATRAFVHRRPPKAN